MNEYGDYLRFDHILTPILLFIVIVLFAVFKLKFKINATNEFRGPPTPFALPIIGHIYLLSKYPTNPWLGFNEIRKKYGDIVYLKLGSCRTVLVSSPDLIRDILLVKGDIFCDRPSIYRHTLIFGGNKENSLALCDWSDLQKLRRTIAQNGILPRFGTVGYKKLAKCINHEIKQMMTDLNRNKQCFLLSKDYVLRICANIFLNFLCSKKFSRNNKEFTEAIYKYDYIFYDINQSYPIDFLPFLSYFGISKRHFHDLRECANTLRKYIEDEVINPRFEQIVKNRQTDAHETAHEEEESHKDFLDYVLEHYLDNPLKISWTACMFEIGDLIGGHSAVGNLLMRLIGHLAVNQNIQQDMHEECVNALRKSGSHQDFITLELRPFLPLIEASIYETLRIASSPIVPHVASQDTTLRGYDIERGTMILFNSYYLNMSDKHWRSPKTFNPWRFIWRHGQEVHLTKPDHFFPFSSGRRACLGYKMVTTITFTAISNLILNYKISVLNDDESKQINQQLAPIGNLALSADNCFKVALIPRTN